MKVLSAKTGASEYVFVMLCSTVFWLRVEAGATKETLPLALARQFRASIPGAIQFLKDVKIPVKDFTKYVDWVESDAPDPDDVYVSYLGEHLDDLRKGLPNIKTNPQATDNELIIINAIRLWHKTSNPNTLEKIRNMLTLVGAPPLVLEQFKVETKSQAPFITELKKLVKKLTGTEGISIPMELRPGIREKKPLFWASYLALRRELTMISKQELRDLVRANGGSMNVEDVRKDFKKRGIVSALPAGFVGNIAEDGGLQTSHGVPIDKANAIDPGSRIQMNPNYTPGGDTVAGRNNNYYMKVTLPTKNADGKNNVAYFYTTTKATQQRMHKFGVVQHMLKNEKKMVAMWRRDLKASPDFEKQVMAAQCEIMYMTCIRIGGVGNKSMDGDTFGLTTLKAGDVKKRGNGYLIDYIGKKSINHKYPIPATTVEARKVAEILTLMLAGKKRSDDLWVDGKTVYNARKFTQYFKQVAGPDATPHKIRHMRGTRLALEELTPLKAELLAKRTLNQSLVDKSFQKALTDVGRMLGHVRGVGAGQTATWQTAVQNYVDPTVMAEFYVDFRSRGIRPPAFLAKFTPKV